MKIELEPSMDEFCSNELLLSKYSFRELEAIYELLKDKKLGKRVVRLLDEQNLIDIAVCEEQLTGNFWDQFKQGRLKYLLPCGEINPNNNCKLYKKQNFILNWLRHLLARIRHADANSIS